MSFRNVLNKIRALKPEKNRISSIGMDIGLSAINLCQLQQQSDHQYLVLAKASIPFSGSRNDLLKSPKVLKELLARGMAKKNFKNRKVVAALPPDQLKITPLTYKSNVANVDQEILKMLSGRLEGDISDYIIDYFPVRSNTHDEENLALATIARNDDVLAYLQTLTNANFAVEALDVGPAALRRLVSSLYINEPAQTILIINAGIETTYLTVISGRRLLFDQPVKFGEQALLEQLSQILELPAETCRQLIFQHGMKTASVDTSNPSVAMDTEYSQAIREILKPSFLELVEEINRVLIFTTSETHGLPVSQVCLLGSMARWPGADELLCELINVPSSCIKDSFEKIFHDPSEPGNRWLDKVPELAIATGLALRGMVDNG